MASTCYNKLPSYESSRCFVFESGPGSLRADVQYNLVLLLTSKPFRRNSGLSRVCISDDIFP